MTWNFSSKTRYKTAIKKRYKIVFENTNIEILYKFLEFIKKDMDPSVR